MKAADCIKKLEQVQKELQDLSKKPKFTEEQVSALQEKLRDIDESWKDGAIHDGDSKEIEKGQALISDLLNDCHELASDLLEQCEG